MYAAMEEGFMNIIDRRVPREFVFRRLHSLMGLCFLLFLIEHLFTNSQIAWFFTDQKLWFVRSVNFLGNIPYLHVLEWVLIGIPIFYHAVLGVYYMLASQSNAYISDGSVCCLKTKKNRAYTWQRLSAWILLLGIALHVIQMRLIHYPYRDQNRNYIKLTVDPGLYKVAYGLKAQLYDGKAIDEEKDRLETLGKKISFVKDRLDEYKKEDSFSGEKPRYDSEMEAIYESLGNYTRLKDHVRGLQSAPIKKSEVMAVSNSFGVVELLMIRQIFQNPFFCIAYSIFILAAVFHGLNGLWTFLITWGILLSEKSQSQIRLVCRGLMFVLGFLGAMSVWGTYLFGSW